MKSFSIKQPGSHFQATGSRRRGSTLLVVIALLAILALMAVVFYTFSAQEQTSAQNFAEAAINEADPGLDADVLFNWGLEQLIKGPDVYRKNSALWGAEYPRHSLIYGMLGNDALPFNGQGINLVINGSTGFLDADQNYNGSGDNSVDNPDILKVNVSPPAQGGETNARTLINNLPASDVDYTSPDINSFFLAYKTYVPGPTWSTDKNDVQLVIIPSFHHPQILRTGSGASTAITDPYNNTTAAVRSLRPNSNHNFIHRETGNDSGSSRFSTNVFDNSGFTNPGALGIWTGHTDTDYALDVDNDGDTIKDGVWLDLDFPPIEDPQNPGNYIIPMFSFTVYDADGLINLNTAGNMRQPSDINLNFAASSGKFGDNLTGMGANQFLLLSRSNQGLSSPGEINPQWAMTATIPGTVGTEFDQHQMFFGSQPTTWPELSNMEYFFLNFGRADYTVPGTIANGTKSDIRDLFPGRWGEPDRLYDAQRSAPGDNLYVVNYTTGVSFPRAGQTLVDDNGNAYEGSNRSGSLQGGRAGAISFKHPLAHNGAGRTWSSANYRQVNLSVGGLGGPARWPAYVDYEIGGLPLTNYPASVRWPYFLFNNPGSVAESIYLRNHLLDDSDEIVVDLEQVQRPYDEPFGPEEMAHLQMSGTDIVNTSVTSRLSDLMPMNFGTTAGADYDRRKRFTTMSWDRNQFSKPVSSIGTGLNNQFPPQYTGAALYNIFRPELLQLLSTGINDNNLNGYQRKLNLNQLLVYENTGTGRTISYRPLTPHPGEDVNGNGSLDVAAGEDLNGNGVLDSLPAVAINSGWSKTSLPAYPPTTYAQQEFWARYDRQRMARDIYSLLYSLNCYTTAPSSASSFTSSDKYPHGYTSNELYQMAQFAVNVVDALDPDNVMTRFEYDTNLNDGWGLDDNPYTNTSAEQGTGQRNVVWGVEEVSLTLSEFILVQCDDQMTDQTVTQFPDDKTDGTDKNRFFTAIELRNNSPYSVPFGSSGKWMVGLEVDGSMVSYAVPRNKSVAAGGLFTLFSSSARDTLQASGGDPYSEFRVDLDGDMAYTSANETIIPSTTIAATDKIDFVNDQATTSNLVKVLNSSFTDITTTPGSFLDQAETQLSATTNDVKVKLFRKAHLGRDTYLTTGSPVPDVDNPWILVDEIAVRKSTFAVTSNTAAAVQAQLDRDAMRSQERSQPLHKRTDTLCTITSGNIRNTIGQRNDRTTSNFTAWQPHFDRDFSSPVELLSIPIVGPTQEIVASQTLPVSATGPNGSNLNGSSNATTTRQRLLTYALVDSGNQQAGTEVQVAGIQKFLNPDGPNDTGPDTDDNYWYRLFEYVEVPTRIHRQLQNPLTNFRVPGKINLNTVRHPSVLAALIDDMGTSSSVLDGSAYNIDVTNAYKVHRLNDANEGSNRNWWEQFIVSRDANDPIAGKPLPGTPGSRPFRSFDYFGSRNTTTNGVRDLRENSLFRTLPNDRSAFPNDPRLLFEVANQSDHQNGPADFHTRNRILSKIMGNTTTRSNTFLVFLSVAYFEASGAGLTTFDDVVQIGDRAHGKSVHEVDYRGFFVIDRTRVEEAYEPSTKKFDHWKRLIRHRSLIQAIQTN
ncbi:hypothetical protein Pan153_56100 [Gimesia panareensis]|uniref:Verru_Chthon cassette protein A n=1 Tax=Gimesia panareensis TaxID=2527978 RepID=A0A518FXE5_9PLAN|nr:hypothetical protein [Gimesia panareensis]QDV20930.1 hypothetical protein Pan153_56100 [Gimesia panareensis]